MPRPLKVFAYTGHRIAAYGPRNVHGQTREVIAATTKTEAHRKSGLARSAFDRTVCETGIEEEIAVATANPGVVFWQPHNRPARDGTWRQVEDPA